MTRFLRIALLLITCISLPSTTFAEDQVDDTEKEATSDVLKCDKTVVLVGDITNVMTAEIQKTLIPCLERGERQTLVVNSPGGEALTSFGIFEAIRIADPDGNLTVRIHGQASSAMVIIALAADHREIGCYSNFFLHDVKTIGVVSASDVELETLTAKNKMTAERYKGIIVSRTGIDLPALEGMMKKETVLLAEEALDLGFATSIVGCE